jgi:replicative DNA helicase
MEKEGLQESSIELLREFGFQPIRAAVRQSIAVVDQARKGLRVVFPTKWSRLNRHLLGGLQPGKMYVIAGRPGCLSGDTMLYVARKGGDGSGRWYTLKYLYEHFNGIGKHSWDLRIPTQTNSFKFDDGMTGLNRISQVVQSGVKETFEVITESGKKIRATKDHLFLINSVEDVEDSWRPLSALKVGDKVICKAPDVSFGRKKRPYRPEINRRMPYYPSAHPKYTTDPNTKVKYGFHRIRRTRAVYDAHLNGLTLNEFLDKVSNDPDHGLVFSDTSMDIHHTDNDCTNDAIGNLQLLTKEAHNRLHSEGKEYEKRFGKRLVRSERIVSIDKPLMEMTYDICMEAPYHNFLADGFVVHNSGKSALSNQMLFDILDLAAQAKKKIVVFYWSFEMPGYQQILRSASKDTGKSLNDFYSVDRSMDDIGFKQFCASVSKLLPYPIYFQNKPRPVKDIVNICLAYSAKNPDVTIINLIDHSRLVPDSEVQQEMERLNILSKACMYMQAETEEKVINILLSQLNRNIEREDRAKNQYQPLLTDLFGGDSIGQDSHVVMMIQRPHDMYGITATYCGEDPRGLLALHIEKNRDGMLGMLPYDFDGARFTITERKKS